MVRVELTFSGHGLIALSVARGCVLPFPLQFSYYSNCGDSFSAHTRITLLFHQFQACAYALYFTGTHIDLGMPDEMGLDGEEERRIARERMIIPRA